MPDKIPNNNSDLYAWIRNVEEKSDKNEAVSILLLSKLGYKKDGDVTGNGLRNDIQNIEKKFMWWVIISSALSGLLGATIAGELGEMIGNFIGTR